MAEQTTYPFQDLLAEKKVNPTELPEKTQKKIAKFNAEQDEDKKETLDESICGDIWDFVEAKEKEAKKAAQKQQHAELKKKKTDVSAAPTAAPAKVEQKKEKSFTDRLFGR